MSLYLAVLAGARTAHVERHVRPRFSLCEMTCASPLRGAYLDFQKH